MDSRELNNIDQLTRLASIAEDMDTGMSESELEEYRAKKKGKSLSSMTKGELCKMLGYRNLKHYMNMNPMSGVSGSVSKKELIKEINQGMTNGSSFMNIGKMLDEEIKKLTPLEREELERELAKEKESEDF